MKGVKETVRENLIKLRKEHKYTQMELAEKIGYSDKAISRWETGEVNPDIETLETLAKLYGVNITVFFSEYSPEQHRAEIARDAQLGRKIAVWILMGVALWYVGIMLYIYSSTFVADSTRSWLIFIWLVPLTFILCSVMNRLWGNAVMGIIFSSLLCWSLLCAIYLHFLEHNLYLLFISGVPIQMAILILDYMKRKAKN